eukprot:TRINITY_DN594_c0_g1_i1.p1 TRINITY_DN594_c0_g1~~TRINITY_DN594_c0_g1_i1.p1  ORF type:complete len:83 (+),score=15.81 TRINITY_DN594_c0_g1_i1:113-361(+)
MLEQRKETYENEIQTAERYLKYLDDAIPTQKPIVDMMNYMNKNQKLDPFLNSSIAIYPVKSPILREREDPQSKFCGLSCIIL